MVRSVCSNGVELQKKGDEWCIVFADRSGWLAGWPHVDSLGSGAMGLSGFCGNRNRKKTVIVITISNIT